MSHIRRYNMRLTWQQDVSLRVLGLMIIGRSCSLDCYVDATSVDEAELKATRLFKDLQEPVPYERLRIKVVQTWPI